MHFRVELDNSATAPAPCASTQGRRHFTSLSSFLSFRLLTCKWFSIMTTDDAKKVKSGEAKPKPDGKTSKRRRARKPKKALKGAKDAPKQIKLLQKKKVRPHGPHVLRLFAVIFTVFAPLRTPKVPYRAVYLG